MMNGWPTTSIAISGKDGAWAVRSFRDRSASALHRRRGAIFIIALAITVILSALLLVYSQEMRTNASESANFASAAQADAVEQGAEQWVLAQVEANTTPLPAAGGSSTSLGGASTAQDPTKIPAMALQVGGGYFWLLHPDPTQDQTYAFGIQDESGKLNLNSATSDQLILLPGMTQDLADSIPAWIQSATSTTAAPADGATPDYYESLKEPYQSKSAANTALGLTTSPQFETVEELLLIGTQSSSTPTCSPQLLYGYDLNHDGVIDPGEMAASNGAAITNGTTTDSRGFFNYVTVYSTVAPIEPVGTPPPAPPRGTFYVGLINVNTAPIQVLQTLPGLTLQDATNIANAQASQATVGSTSWISSVISSTKAAAIAPYITGQSYQYSADIVAVSGDGRAFKRVRIVVDARAQPATIVYRKDLTNLGWPLPADVLTSMRTGKGVPQYVTGTTNQEQATGLSQ
jgi:DNA uptake protein ComE-like DNA-binding protein